MKLGNVSESVLKRSILKQIKYTRPEILHGASLSHDCPAIELNDGEIMVMATLSHLYAREDFEILGLNGIINSLIVSGAEPLGVMLNMMLPEWVQESDLKMIIKNCHDYCEKFNMQLMGGNTEFTDVVNRPLISITGVGKVGKDQLLTLANCKPGQDIVMSKSIGIEGTYIAALKNKVQLEKRFNQVFINKVMEYKNDISIFDEAAVAIKHGVTAMHDITTGGIFSALWELGTGAKCGLEVDLKSITIKQETVEVCEFLELNPYQLLSRGSVLMVTDDGHGLVKELKMANIDATLIGKLTSGNDKIITNHEEIRYLEPPNKDELLRMN